MIGFLNNMQNKELFISLDEYDYHSILKVIEISGNLGIIKVFDAPGGYNIVFCDSVMDAQNIFKQRLDALTENFWKY